MDVGRTAHLDDSGRGNVWCFNLLVFHGQTLHKRVTPDLRGGGEFDTKQMSNIVWSHHHHRSHHGAASVSGLIVL